MKTMTAVKKVAAVATMWWVMVPMLHFTQGGQPVAMWMGPWETKSMCHSALGGFMEGFNKSASADPDTAAMWGQAICTYKTQTP
jgi:hypothetical protein